MHIMYLFSNKIGLKLEFGKNNMIVRYHPAPVQPVAGQLEASDNTSCLGKQQTKQLSTV